MQPQEKQTPTRRMLRRQLRQRRRELSAHDQRKASRAVSGWLQTCPSVIQANHVALYWPNDGEIDPRPFLDRARDLRITCYLPVLHPVHRNRLWFFRYDHNTRLTPNRFGIPEPSVRNHRARPAWALDVILMPLVGFTEGGDRLGMGGGFYDRSLEFTRHTQRRPRLIGLAHECQKVERMPTARWDIPMDCIVTDRGIYRP